MNADRRRAANLAADRAAREQAAERALANALRQGVLHSWDKVPSGIGTVYRLTPASASVRLPVGRWSLADLEKFLAGVAAGLTAREPR